MERFNRVKLLIGESALAKLNKASVAVFGVGGVGGYTVEALARSGIGNITIFDSDVVAKSNINRQIIATDSTVGLDKVEVLKERILSINPSIKVTCYKQFYLPENADKYPFDCYDYVVDAVDTVSAKVEIILRAKKANVPVISCMGTGGKTDPSLLKVADISKTQGCPLARVMRKQLKDRGISHVKTVYSPEERLLSLEQTEFAEKTHAGRIAPASMIFVPATAGLMLAREVVFDIIGEKE